MSTRETDLVLSFEGLSGRKTDGGNDTKRYSFWQESRVGHSTRFYHRDPVQWGASEQASVMLALQGKGASESHALLRRGFRRSWKGAHVDTDGRHLGL